MIRVGFILKPSRAAWMGGINYFSNLFKALEVIPDSKIKPILFTGFSINEGILAKFKGVEVVQSALFDKYRPEWALGQLTKRVLGYDSSLERLLQKYDVRALSHSGFIRRGSRITTLGWIPDFQHKYLQDFFSAHELQTRDQEFEAIIDLCDCVLLSSYDSFSAMKDFFPEGTQRAKVLQFVAEPANASLIPSLRELEHRYQFSGPYFHLPNQFWKHKNHSVVIEALTILKSRGLAPTILSTGSTDDYRHPGFFRELMDKVLERGLSENFRPLGLVPFADMISLMEKSVAVINPSLFEGWSTTVEEAKSLGKRIVLSDLPVHREQDPRDGIYFSPRDPGALAEALIQAQGECDPVAETARRKLAQSSFASRQLEFGLTYQSIVLDLLKQ